MNFINRSILTLFHNWKHIRFYSVKSRSHYESLGVPTNSTQVEIKSAYYKLSMLYHPDKTEGNPEYAQKFRDITEAYEVLGNVQSRKLYDKRLHIGLTQTRAEPQINTFYKSRETRSRPPPPSGRTPIYNFDEWSKNHYGKIFSQKQENIRRAAQYQKEIQNEKDDLQINKLMWIGFILILLSMFFSNRNYDKILEPEKKIDS